MTSKVVQRGFDLNVVPGGRAIPALVKVPAKVHTCDRVRVALEHARLLVEHLEGEAPDLSVIRTHALTLFQFVDGDDSPIGRATCS